MTDTEKFYTKTVQAFADQRDELIEKLDKIKRLALAHNSSAVNIGAHRLAGLILKIVAQK